MEDPNSIPGITLGAPNAKTSSNKAPATTSFSTTESLMILVWNTLEGPEWEQMRILLGGFDANLKPQTLCQYWSSLLILSVMFATNSYRRRSSRGMPRPTGNNDWESVRQAAEASFQQYSTMGKWYHLDRGSFGRTLHDIMDFVLAKLGYGDLMSKKKDPEVLSEITDSIGNVNWRRVRRMLEDA